MVVKRIQTEPRYARLMRAAPTLTMWGVAAAAGLLLFASDVPLARKDILSKIFMVGKYFPVENIKADEED